MYSYIKAVVLAKTIGSQWREVDLRPIVVRDIYNTYRQVYLELSNPFIEGHVYVDFIQYRTEFSNFQGTLEQWFTEIGNRSLDTVPSIPSNQVRYVKYSDAFYSGYKANITKIGVNNPGNYPRSELRDLVISRPHYDTDLSLLHTHCLLTVNGLIHQTDTDGVLAYIYDGGYSASKSNTNTVGILSFLDVGRITKIRLQASDIYPDVDGALRDRTYLHVAADTTNKTVILVLGGYMILPDAGVFWQSGDHVFALNPLALPLVERYFESNLTLDLSSLGLELSEYNPDAISLPEFLSDEVLKKYLTLSQSFIVVIDTPDFFAHPIYLRHCNLPGMFTAYQDPVYPLIVNYGKMAEYWKTHEDGHWSVTVTDSFLRNYVFTHRPIYQIPTVTPQVVPEHTFEHSRGYLLEMGSYT